MISEKENTHISKFLSLVLRHKPETIDITLDENGWTDVGTLIQQLNSNGFVMSKDILTHVVKTNTKKRFAFNQDCTLIRASQGHSVEVELDYEAQQPPAVLYHGTVQPLLSSIFKTGLIKGKRHHVHLSIDIETASKVGKRHGTPIILAINAKEMYNNGLEFFVSENCVWLTDHVPVRYLAVLNI